MVGNGDGDREHRAERAQQGDEKTDEPDPSPLKDEHRLVPPWQDVDTQGDRSILFLGRSNNVRAIFSLPGCLQSRLLE